MFSHNLLDSLGGLVSVVEGDGAHVVVKDVSFDDSMEDVAADEAKFAINGGSSSASEGPDFRSVVGERWIGVLEVGDRNYSSQQCLLEYCELQGCTYRASGSPIGKE